MITVYFGNENQKLTTFTSTEEENIYEKIARKSWIHLTSPTEQEVTNIAKLTSIPEEVIRVPLDEEESAHLDIDDDITLVVVDMPVVDVDEENPDINKYYTTPFGIIYNNDYIITTCLRDKALDYHVTKRMMKNFGTNKHIKLTIQILYRNASLFVNSLKQLDKDSDSVQKRLHISMKNKELFELMSLNKSLVYLSTGINANNLVLEKIKRHETFKQYEEDLDLIEDTIIETRQAMEMCNIHRDILTGTMDAFASVISNNVNTVMKTLTVVTIILTIPTLIASFFGMNVDVPFRNQVNGFWIIFIFSIILSILGAVLLISYTSKFKEGRGSNFIKVWKKIFKKKK